MLHVFLAEIKFQVKISHYCCWSAKSTHADILTGPLLWPTFVLVSVLQRCCLCESAICSWKTPQYQLHISRLLLWEIRAQLLGYCWRCWFQILCSSNRIFWWKCFLSMWAANLKIKQGAKWKSSDNISCNFVWKLWVFRCQTGENKQYLLLLK